MRKKIISLFLLFVVMLTTGFGCKTPSAVEEQAMKPITINYWRAWDDTDAFSEVIAKYNAIHPNIQIKYRKFRFEEYESELLNALAEDRGPDIFSVPVSWLGKYKAKISPMPSQTTMAYSVLVGTLKKEASQEMRTSKSLSVKDLRTNYVDVVAGDVIMSDFDEASKVAKENIYGLPLYVDTLALYYNKDLMNNAGISEPPLYWNKAFQQYVQKLTKQNTKGEIIQSGIALGGGKNIDRSSDILSLLMMQNGATMISESGGVSFQNTNQSSGFDFNPGIEAIRFYNDFANPAKEVYCWNETLDSSIKMFTSNRLAMMLGYSYNLPVIRAEAPKMNFAVAKLPQIENSNKSVNFANYWVETVSRKSKYKNEAWDFVQFLTKAENVQSYLDKAKRPTALRSLVSKQTEDPDIGIFAEQVLTAKDWYKGTDGAAADAIMQNLIDEAKRADNETINSVVNIAAMRIQQTLK